MIIRYLTKERITEGSPVWLDENNIIRPYKQNLRYKCDCCGKFTKLWVYGQLLSCCCSTTVKSIEIGKTTKPIIGIVMSCVKNTFTNKLTIDVWCQGEYTIH